MRVLPTAVACGTAPGGALAIVRIEPDTGLVVGTDGRRLAVGYIGASHDAAKVPADLQLHPREAKTLLRIVKDAQKAGALVALAYGDRYLHIESGGCVWALPLSADALPDYPRITGVSLPYSMILPCKELRAALTRAKAYFRPTCPTVLRIEGNRGITVASGGGEFAAAIQCTPDCDMTIGVNPHYLLSLLPRRGSLVVNYSGPLGLIHMWQEDDLNMYVMPMRID